MTTEGARRPGGGERPVLVDVPSAGRVLVRSTRPPEVPDDRCVDVRPGGVATFDGDRVRLSLWVSDGDTRVPVAWTDLDGLEAAVTASLREGGGSIRFGGRDACRSALGTAAVEAVECRLGDIARRRDATLVSWTVAAPRDGDYRTYDVVLDGAGTRVG